MIGAMNLQFIKRSLCLFLFMGCWGVQSAGLVCDRIWTARCDDCPAPMLMECEGEVKGHIKNSSVIKTLRMLFYVTGEDGAEIRTVEINGFQLYPSFDEDSHGTLWRDKMERAWPDVSIVGFKIQYILDQDARFYEDPDGQFLRAYDSFHTGTPDEARAVERLTPIQDSNSVSGPAVDQTSSNRLPENSPAMELKKEQPLMKQEKAKTEEERIEREREYVEKHWTGNEEIVRYQIPRLTRRGRKDLSQIPCLPMGQREASHQGRRKWSGASACQSLPLHRDPSSTVWRWDSCSPPCQIGKKAILWLNPPHHRWRLNRSLS